MSLHSCKLAKGNSNLKIHKVNPSYMDFENNKRGVCVFHNNGNMHK